MKKFCVLIAVVTTTCALSLAPAVSHAQTYNGPGIVGGAALAGAVVNSANFRLTVINYVRILLSFMALAATAVIVIGGIILVFSLGDDAVRDKVKKMVIFVAVGLVIIMLAQGVVGIFVRISST